MPSRQDLLLDAAIEILGGQGLRALTHRAVDAAAGMPAGSAANYFKTRDALIGAVADRFATRDRAAWEAIAGFIRPKSRADLAAAMAAFVRRALGPDRTMTVARYALFTEAALRPDLQSRLSAPAKEIRGWGAEWLREIGSAAPEAECEAILDYVDGVMLHQLAFPTDPRSVETAVTRTVQTLCTSR